jgi:ribosome biogenesis GTPase / thiamine phosphate phosphatase
VNQQHHADEHQPFERPRRHTRPRTKDRPDYSAAPIGRVIRVDRGRLSVQLDKVTLNAIKARSLGRKGVVVGDEVRMVGDLSGMPGSLARIVEVAPRKTVLRRTADDDDPVERIIVANADQLVIVVALADPEPRPGLIDRALVAAYDSGMNPLLCLTKADLASPEKLLLTYQSLGLPWVVTQQAGDLAPLRSHLKGKTSVMIGHSGVGKSTLVNALVPDAHRQVGVVNAVTGRGRHTSTSAVLLALPHSGEQIDGAQDAGEPEHAGFLIDTPGIRSFGLAHVRPEQLIVAFTDLEQLTQGCPRGCTHGTGEPECGLDRASEATTADPARVESFRRLLSARERAEDTY